MESTGTSSVQYDRWNEDNINMNVERQLTPSSFLPLIHRIYSRMCTGSTGIAVKAAGAVAALVAAYMLGYVTGYHIHRCP
uniref:Small integral membrane protein 1 n=1 Tax=Amphilophus citrinellus TaxID=61819 RepID=A0A3Q0S620_AMPCI